jgi:hypothetical protein
MANGRWQIARSIPFPICDFPFRMHLSASC